MIDNIFIVKKNSARFLILFLNLALALIFLTGCASLSEKYIAEGLSLYDSTYYNDAEEKFILAIAEDSSSEQAYFNLGRTRSRLEKYRLAAEDFSRSILLKPRKCRRIFKQSNNLYAIGRQSKVS